MGQFSDRVMRGEAEMVWTCTRRNWGTCSHGEGAGDGSAGLIVRENRGCWVTGGGGGGSGDGEV